jgi:hypothetical protein
MTTVDNLTKIQPRKDSSYFLTVLSDDGTTWVVSLPPKLKIYQPELEALLGKVFTDRRLRAENLQLAQQLSINWCRSKCRQVGLSIEESWS